MTDQLLAETLDPFFLNVDAVYRDGRERGWQKIFDRRIWKDFGCLPCPKSILRIRKFVSTSVSLRLQQLTEPFDRCFFTAFFFRHCRTTMEQRDRERITQCCENVASKIDMTKLLPKLVQNKVYNSDDTNMRRWTVSVLFTFFLLSCSTVLNYIV